jgi:hypothetical protein
VSSAPRTAVSIARVWRAVLAPALAYFALVFGTGFLLGPPRVLWLEPRVGARAALLLEAPLMLVAMGLAARWIVRRRGPGWPRSTRLATGALAGALVLAADLGVGVWWRGLSPSAVFMDRDPIAGPVYYGLVVLFALLPWLLHGEPP